MPTAKNCYRFLCLCMAVLICTVVNAQQTHFIHIQTEGNQPFYIQLNETVYNSTAGGTLEIPQLTAGAHTFYVGFPGNGMTAYTFQCAVNDMPIGFTLKKGIDNNWSLFDMVAFTVSKGIPIALSQLQAASLKKAVPGQPDAAVVNDQPGSPPPAKDKISSVSRIRKIFDKATPGGVDQVYIVLNDNKADTVALFIPALSEGQSKESGSMLLPGRVPFPLPVKKDRMAVVLFRQTLLSKLFYAPVFPGTGL